jgi:CubicO group peptidase (beta-lactamase class C family)
MISSGLKHAGWLTLSVALLVSTLPVQAADDYRHAQEPIGTVREIYDGTLFPDVQVNTFRNIDRLFPTRIVKRGGHVYPLSASDKKLENFRFESAGKIYDLYDFLSLNRVSGIIVIKDDQVVFEKYLLGNDDTSRWMSMSVVKSITATLVGMAIKDGYIGSINDPVTKYVKELSGSAYEGVTVKQVLQMASGVDWNETYTDPQSDRRAMLEAQIAQQPGGILKVMGALGRAAKPGTRWNYSTGETQVVGALVAAATGKTISDYLSEKLWAPFGMEADANWWLESPDGLEIGGSGLSATLRDYARFGLFLLHGGKINGQPQLPDGWIEQASRPQMIDGKLVDYGYMLWPLDHGAYAGIGIFGQFVVVDPSKNMVVAMWGAQPKPVGMESIDEYVFFNALADAVD